MDKTYTTPSVLSVTGLYPVITLGEVDKENFGFQNILCFSQDAVNTFSETFNRYVSLYEKNRLLLTHFSQRQNWTGPVLEEQVEISFELQCSMNPTLTAMYGSTNEKGDRTYGSAAEGEEYNKRVWQSYDSVVNDEVSFRKFKETLVLNSSTSPSLKEVFNLGTEVLVTQNTSFINLGRFSRKYQGQKVVCFYQYRTDSIKNLTLDRGNTPYWRDWFAVEETRNEGEGNVPFLASEGGATKTGFNCSYWTYRRALSGILD